MISAVSGSTNAAALLSLFSRPTNATTDAASTSATKVAARPPPPPDRPPPGGMGATAEAMFASLLNALSGNGQAASTSGTDSDGDSDGSSASATSATGSGSGTLADMLTKLVSALDTNGDGQLSADELKAGVQALQDSGTSTATTAAQGHHHHPDGDGDDAGGAAATTASSASSAASAKDAAKSLYESLFNAVANEAPGATSVSIGSDVAQRFLSAIKIAA